MSEAFFANFPLEHRMAMANARPGSSISTDMNGTTVVGPRTFEPSPVLADKSPSNLIAPSSPFSNIYFAAYSAPTTKILDTRTVLIAIDGACSGNGTPSAVAGLGVYFGPNSPHNISERITGTQTSQRAEILAAIRALRKVSGLLANVFSVNRIVLLTDSSYVAHAMTDWIFTWKENGWKNSNGGPVVNKAEFKELDEVIETLEEDGLDVLFWLVRREDNRDADRLATASYA